MTIIYDGQKTIKASMRIWNDNNGYGPDMIGDMIDFEGYDDILGALKVSSVDDVIDYLNAWAAGKDDATMDELRSGYEEDVDAIKQEIENRSVEIYVLSELIDHRNRLSHADLVAAANRYVEKKYPYRSKAFDGNAFLQQVMQDGEGGEIEDGVSKTWFFMPSDNLDFCGRIIQYDRVIYDEDGEIDGYDPIGWELE